jgi:Zn-dependent protease
MRENIKLGHIWGIPIGLNASWFLVFGLVTWTLSTGLFPGRYAGLPDIAYWIMGAATSILFFSSVLLHELGHAFFAIRSGIPVNRITLFIFGGVAEISREPRTPSDELRIAIAGPITSLALAIGFGSLGLAGSAVPVVAVPALWLARVNLALAFFNMIPAFPLDGGRVLRALVWQFGGSFRGATRVASLTGQIAAYGFIGFGLFSIFGGNLLNGAWLAFIGWFMQNAASASYAQADLQHSLSGMTAAQAMTRDHVRVPSDLTLNELVELHMLNGGHRVFFVDQEDQIGGMLTLLDLKNTPRSEWSNVTAAQAMRPNDEWIRIDPETELFDALKTMEEAKVNRLQVVDGGALVGVLSRDRALRYIRLLTELGLRSRRRPSLQLSGT